MVLEYDMTIWCINDFCNRKKLDSFKSAFEGKSIEHECRKTRDGSKKDVGSMKGRAE